MVWAAVRDWIKSYNLIIESSIHHCTKPHYRAAHHTAPQFTYNMVTIAWEGTLQTLQTMREQSRRWRREQEQVGEQVGGGGGALVNPSNNPVSFFCTTLKSSKISIIFINMH